VAGIRVSHSSDGDRRRRKECQPVSENLQVWKAKVAANDVDALREIEPKAIKEAQTPRFPIDGVRQAINAQAGFA
jgi:hypothetical protein